MPARWPGSWRSIPSLRRIIGAGKEKALGFLMGRVMKELKGKADPGAVNALLKSRLETGGSEGG